MTNRQPQRIAHGLKGRVKKTKVKYMRVITEGGRKGRQQKKKKRKRRKLSQ